MAGPERALGLVPLNDVLPRHMVGPGTPEAVRRLFADVEAHPSAVGRCEWYWFPESTDPPIDVPHGISLSLLTLAVPFARDLSDWLELAFDIGWSAPPALTISAAVEVACWCQPDHGIHAVREIRHQVSTADELLVAVGSGGDFLTQALTTGPSEPEEWRRRAGLPGRVDRT